jgi:hypothetical protein
MFMPGGLVRGIPALLSVFLPRKREVSRENA